MIPAQKKFYLFFALATSASYLWLALVAQLNPAEIGNRYDFCMIHHFVHIPCPSCGSTRSVLALMQGDFAGGWYWNPLGFLILGGLILAPWWIGYDLMCKKDSLFRFISLSEATLRRRWVAIPLIILILLNWCWSISKNI